MRETTAYISIIENGFTVRVPAVIILREHNGVAGIRAYR
jgi:hypothetical protein